MKKLLSMVLALVMVLSLAVTVSAECDHQLMKMANMNSHYSECTICFELFDVGEHTFENGACTVCGHAEYKNPFVDVPSDAWYHDEVVKAVDTGIINGKTETEFKPDDLLTYAEALKLAACMNQVYLNGSVSLTAGDPWYKPYVDYCMAAGIADKEYDYNQSATRAGYMEIFANALPDEAFAEINNIPDGSILDVKNKAPYAIYVYKLYRAGIVTGVDELHNCNPEENIKRSEVAAIISRMMDEEKRVEFEMPDTNEGDITNNRTNDDDDDKNKPEASTNTEGSGKDYTDEGKDVEINKDHQSIVVTPNDADGKPKFEASESPILSILTIYKQPEGYEAEAYGEKYEAEVQVYGGKAPYSYQWFYHTGYRNETAAIENGDYVKDVTSDALVLSIEKENTLLGRLIYCEITDSEGAKVTTDKIKVYGPFSMPVENSLNDSGKNVLAGRVADGILKKGDKISVIRDGKVIAIGIAEDLQMFDKSLDETVKGDNVGIVFDRKEGVRPAPGDVVVKYQESHVLDTSDVIN